MKFSEKVKQAGFKSIKELSEITKVPVRTLQTWNTTKPDLIETIIEGAKQQKEQGND